MVGHVLRNEVLLRDITEGRMKGKSYRGKKRLYVLSNLACSSEYPEVKTAAADQELARRTESTHTPKDCSYTTNFSFFPGQLQWLTTSIISASNPQNHQNSENGMSAVIGYAGSSIT